MNSPNVLPCVVTTTTKGAGGVSTLKSQFGTLNGERLVQLANQIPIKGGNVVNVVYDATALAALDLLRQGRAGSTSGRTSSLTCNALDADGDSEPDLP